MIKTKRVNILVPNATSPKNIGDQAMLEVLMKLVKAAFKNASISLHSTDPNLHDKTYKALKIDSANWRLLAINSGGAF